MSEFFINRPHFAWVVALFISLAGILAIPSLPVEKYPQVAPPQIFIEAVYPGASASVLNNSVTSPIEEELNGAKGLLYYESTSNSNGIAEITVTFQPGVDPAMAQVDVQNRIKKAEARLPDVVKQQGLQVEQVNAGFLLIYAMSYKEKGTGKDPQALADFMARNINNEIRRVPGVGKVQFFGSESAMRVWVVPENLLKYDLSLADVNRAIAQQNVQVPAGSFGDRPGADSQEVSATLVVKGTLATPEEFGRIVLRADKDGSIVRLSDVARLEIGSQSYHFDARLNGVPGVCAAVQLAPGANALNTANAVKQRIKELSATFPEEMGASIPYDTSTFVRVAIEKVTHTLLEAVILVFIVILLFLQNLRYTLIPTIVVPVCLLGTLALMSSLGFSVNMMTMFAMVLAIGILVDDAIVVVENVERIMAEEGLGPKEATRKSMKQITGAIVGITLVLSAVFLPLAFVTGSVGVIYRQFSMVMAVSILISGFLALTMTPALCATMLQPVPLGRGQAKKGTFGLFNLAFGRVTKGYSGLTSGLVVRGGRVMVVYVVLAGLLGYTYVRLPQAFVPAEDQGTMLVSVQLPSNATYGRTLAVIKDMENHLMSRPAMKSVISVMGFSFSGMGQNAAIAFPSLKDWSLRGKGQSAMDEIMAANQFLAGTKDGTAFAVNPPPVDGLGNAGGFSLRIQDRVGLGREKLSAALYQVLGRANPSPVIAYAMVEGLPDAPQLRLTIDRQKAQALGIGFPSINTVVSTAFGSSMINDFVNKGRVQRVVVQADSASRVTPESLDRLYVPNNRGEQVPLKAFTTLAWEAGPVQVVRYNGFPSFRIAGDAAPGFSTGEAMAEMEKILADLPPGIGYEWTGLSFQEKCAGAQAPRLFGLAILVVFLLLVALYESWSIPLSVMLIIPLGALGAVLATMGMDMTNDVYFKVGLITIIGLAAKNAILIAEFAKELTEQGHSLVEAAVMSAGTRFRPIVMTSMAFILGVVPLAVATGAGAASQRAIGTGVIGGMLGATLLGLIFAPVFFVWVLSLFKRR